MNRVHGRRRAQSAASLFEQLEPRQLLAVIAWDGGGDGGTLLDPLNWAGDVLPGPADDALVDVPGVAMVAMSAGSLSVNSLTMAEDFSMSGGFLEVATPSLFSGETDWSGGMIGGSGRLLIPAAGVLNIGGPVDPRLIIQNFGTINWTSGDIESGGTPFWITNQAGGTFTMSGLNATMGAGTLANYGTIVVAPPPGGVITIEARVVNLSDLIVASGKLALTGSGRLNDSIVVSTPEGLDIAGLFEYFGTTISGAGSVRFLGGGQILEQSGLDLQADALLQGAQIRGGGDLTVSSRVEWQSGRILGAGEVTITPAGTLVLAGPLTKAIGRDITNDGAITHPGGALRFVVAGATLTNNGQYTFAGNAQVLSLATGDAIENTGAIVKLGPGTTTIQPALNSSGAVNVGGGNLNIDGGGVNTGSRHIGLNSSLVYRSDYAHGAGSTATGAGSLVFAGGTQDIAGDWTASSVVKLVSGTLAGAGQLTVTGPLFWIGGNMFGPGELVIGPTGKLAVISGAEREFGRRVVNSGLVLQSGGTLVFQGGELHNNASGRLALLAGEVRTGGAGGTIVNQGLMQKIGPSIFVLPSGGPTLSNTGALEVRGGELNIVGALSQLSGGTLAAGTWRVLPFGTLRFGTRTLTALASDAVVELNGSEQRMPGIATLESNTGTIRLDSGQLLRLTPDSGMFTNNGLIELLNPMATLAVNGALALGAGSHLLTTAADPFTFSRVFANSTTLGGAYTMSFLGGLFGDPGTTFQFLTAGSRVGEFAQPNLPAGTTIQYTPTGAQVLVVSTGT